jgi:NADH-quinone oxidoreductase subunit J
MDLFLFLFFALVAVGCAINMLVQKHPIHGAISLIGVMASLAMLYLILGGEFIAAAQVIVYAGAIMVLFVFVIMLLNAGREGPSRQPRMVRWLGIPVFAGFLAVLGYLVQRLAPSNEGVRFGAFTGGTAHAVGMKLFTEYLLPFELTSVLVLIAILGAIVLARKELD